MTYTKPEVVVLGDASQVITHCGSQTKNQSGNDGQGCSPPKAGTGAYDLDE